MSGFGLSGRPSRRRLLQWGIAGPWGLTLPRLLVADERRGADGSAARARSCILVVVSGGLSHLDTLDPKPGAPVETRGPYGVIPTSVPGITLSEMLPCLARSAHRFSLIRSMSHGDAVHVSAAHTMLTGGADGSTQDDSPLIGSLVARFRPSSASVPSYVWLHNMKTGTNKVPRYESGLSKIGHAWAPLRIGYELDNAASPEFRVRHFDPPEGVSTGRLSGRLDLVRELEVSRALPADRADELDEFRQGALRLLTTSEARRAFELSHESGSMRERYGLHPLGQYLLLARRLVEAGVRLVTVTAWPGLAPGETTPTVTQVWDMHGDRYAAGDSMYGNGPFGMKWSLPRFDQALAALLDDLDERGLLDETLVAVTSEFGRTPKFEVDGRGRGHWPACYSGLVAGGGMRRGFVYGSSDRQGAFVAEGRPVSQLDFGATLFAAMGIPPDTRYGPDGFSLKVSEGQVVGDLLA